MNANRKLVHLFGANIITSIGSGVTSFIVPYLIISLQGGERLFGYLLVAITILVFFLSPYLGALIDRYSRKHILILCELLSVVSLGIILTYYLVYGDVPFYLLAGYAVINSIYDSVQIPTLMAFTQEIFDKEQFNKVNGVMEVQSQSATFISAGLVALLISRFDSALIFTIDILSSLIAVAWLSLIPYHRTVVNVSSNNIKIENVQFTLLNDIKEALSYMKKNISLIIFLVCALFPSIMVLIGNYVNPVFLYTDLGLLPDVQGYSSVIYAISAMTGGVVASLLAVKFGNYVSIFITYLLYLIFIVGIFLFPAIIPFLIFRTLSGVGNAGSRVLRKNIMMEKIPNNLIGKVNSFMNSFSLLVQSILIGYFSLTISQTGARGSFLVMAVIMAIGFAIMFAVKPANKVQSVKESYYVED